jgi:hypothetical protein
MFIMIIVLLSVQRQLLAASESHYHVDAIAEHGGIDLLYFITADTIYAHYADVTVTHLLIVQHCAEDLSGIRVDPRG